MMIQDFWGVPWAEKVFKGKFGTAPPPKMTQNGPFWPKIAKKVHFHDSSFTKICDRALRVTKLKPVSVKGNIKINYTILWFQSKGNTLYS